MAVRNLLSKNKLEAFKQWLEENKWQIVPVKGEYEILRGKRNGRCIIIYERNNSKEHLSVRDCDVDVIKEFLNYQSMPAVKEKLDVFSVNDKKKPSESKIQNVLERLNHLSSAMYFQNKQKEMNIVNDAIDLINDLNSVKQN